MSGDPEAIAAVIEFFERSIPFNRFLGFRVERHAPGECLVRVPWRPEFVGDPERPALHGGLSATVADTAGGLACLLALGGLDHPVSTIDFRVDYLKAGRLEDLLCAAKVLRLGARIAVVRMELYSGSTDEAPIAVAQGAYAVTRRAASRGR
ncbi:MAG: hotdog fold thioesterase [Myxococcales bacterium]|nr:hotdog fold thioesterase [Myxococcales bacterium]